MTGKRVSSIGTPTPKSAEESPRSSRAGRGPGRGGGGRGRRDGQGLGRLGGRGRGASGRPRRSNSLPPGGDGGGPRGRPSLRTSLSSSLPGGPQRPVPGTRRSSLASNGPPAGSHLRRASLSSTISSSIHSSKSSNHDSSAKPVGRRASLTGARPSSPKRPSRSPPRTNLRGLSPTPSAPPHKSMSLSQPRSSHLPPQRTASNPLEKYKPSEAYQQSYRSEKGATGISRSSERTRPPLTRPPSILKNNSHIPPNSTRSQKSKLSETQPFMGLDTPSRHFPLGLHLFKPSSNRSVLTEDRGDFEDDSYFVRILRYIRLLPPHANEKPLKKWIRIITWLSLLCDITAALVSIVTYDGVTKCCGRPILSVAGGNTNWDVIIRIVTYLYIILILAEVIPVTTHSLPLNLMNPIVGFMITFAVFFNDRIVEAVIMWVIEATAVCCEFAIYRLNCQVYDQKEERLETIDKELRPFRRKRRDKHLHGDEQSIDDDNYSEFGSTMSEASCFHDEDEERSTAVDLSQARELRLLRERRILRIHQAFECRMIRYHMGGVILNATLVVIALLLIVLIGRSGGLCIKNMSFPNVFQTDQLERCSVCAGKFGACQVCDPDGTSSCYFPYY